MNKTFYYITAAVLTLGLSSCAKEVVVSGEAATTEVSGQMTIVADISDGASTKTTLSGNDTEGYKVLWSEGDTIILKKESDVAFSTVYTLSEGAGSTTGKFTGAPLADGAYVAYYAYDPTQPLLFGEQSGTSGQSVSNAPMTARFNISKGVESSVNFKNACGLLRLDLKGTVVIKSIKITTKEGLVSHFSNFREDGSMGVQDPEHERALKYITLDCGPSGRALSDSYQPFYIAMPPGNYSGVKIEMNDSESRTFTKTLKAEKTLSIARAQISPVALTCAPIIKVTGISLDKTSLALSNSSYSNNFLYNLHASVTPNNATNKSIIWTSSDPDVATVSNDGVVAVNFRAGNTTITAEAADGSGVKATCHVTVTLYH